MVLVSFLLIGAAFGFASRQVFVSEARESMMTNSREISRMAVAYAAEGDLRSLELRMTLSTIGASTNQHIFIVNPSGYIITCSDSAVFCEHIGKRLDESVSAILPDSGTITSLGTLGGFYASEHYTVISALTDDGTLLGHLFVSKDTGTALSIWETIVPLFFLISLIVLCLALIFSYASSKYFAKPLRDMADAARRFGRGELDVRVEPTDSTDEIGELTEAFNSMADSLEQSETKRREFIANVSHELKTPMTTISGFADGILDGTIPPESEKKYLQIISSETKRLARLVRSMLELSRLQAKDRATLLKNSFDISEQLRLTLMTWNSMFPKRPSTFLATWTPSRRSSTICLITPSNSPAKIHSSPSCSGRITRRRMSPSETAAARFRRRRFRSSLTASTNPTAAAARIVTASVSAFISSKPF